MASAFHKYCIGQTVSFVPGSGSLSHLRGSCTIVRLLPSETRDWQYRQQQSSRCLFLREPLGSQGLPGLAGP